ncbi:MAG TPA: hypothetical protein VGI39_09090 [Polyangiaceae bacterium]
MITPSGDGAKAATVRVQPTLVTRGDTATLSWEALGASAVTLSIHPSGTFVNARPVNSSCVVGSIPIVLPEAGDYWVELRADYATNTTQVITAKVTRAHAWIHWTARLLATVAVVTLVTALVKVAVLPDQVEKTGIGAVVKTVSWVTGALGAVALLPVLVSGLTGGDSVFVRLGRLLPTRLGVGLAMHVLACAGAIGLGTYLMTRSMDALVINESSRDVYFESGSDVIYALPVGVTAIRPRNSTLALMRAPPDGGAAYFPPRLRPIGHAEGVVRLRCDDQVSVVAPELEEVLLVLDGKAVKPSGTGTAANCGDPKCAEYRFDLEDKDCTSYPLKAATKVSLRARDGNQEVSADWPRDQATLTIARQALHAPWPNAMKFSARASGLAMTGACAAQTCSWLGVPALEKTASLDWSFPASTASWRNPAAEFDPHVGWLLLVQATLADLAPCTSASQDAGASVPAGVDGGGGAPACPLRAIPVAIDRTLVKAATVVGLKSSDANTRGPLWLFAGDSTEHLTAYGAADPFETMVWSQRDQTSPALATTSVARGDGVSIAPARPLR